MRALVTGAAGFIGSHLVEALLRQGAEVTALDSFTDYYDPERKRANVRGVIDHEKLRLIEGDVARMSLAPVLDGVDVVFHLAGQPGVRASWADAFDQYVERNVTATQRLLEAAAGTGLRRFVYASSSSIYGNALTSPTTEETLPRPHSPYGVTKLAAEHLCGVYARNHGVPTVALRYFTVYGSRQRPDMAAHRLVEAAITGAPFVVFGDGSQLRDVTHVRDVVAANLAAAASDAAPGTIVNIAGGSTITLRQLAEHVERLTDRTIDLRFTDAQPGDVRRTSASIDAAEELLGWRPATSLDEGLREQVAWHTHARIRA